MTVTDEIKALLARPGEQPGCYDRPEYIALEKTDVEAAFQGYADFVVTREQSEAEKQRVREVVRVATAAIAAAPRENLRGQCVTLACSLVRILERYGCWAFPMTGSARVRFPPESRLETRYLRIGDPSNVPGLVDGHAWVVAPPFDLIDASLRFQRWDGNQPKYIPATVLSANEAEHVPYQSDLWSLRSPPGRVLHSLWEKWPTRTVALLRGANATYQTHGITLPDVPLDRISLRIRGRPIAQFVEREIAPQLSSLIAAP